MRPRQEVVEVFSTFIQFEADSFNRWLTDARLHRSMQNCLSKGPGLIASENLWVLFWHKTWQKQPNGLAANHLLAYLQEPCYWAAQRIVEKAKSSQYRLTDCFQIAIVEADAILKRFNPDRNSNLKSYASITFSSLIRDFLRQQRETDICTDWALLRKISKKKLGQSLQNAGLSPTTIAQYHLAWDCFKDIYVQEQATPTSRLPKPDHSVFEAISKLYNLERKTQLSSPGAECNPEIIERWLLGCAKMARSYLYPSISSLNAPKIGQETGEVQDDLSDSTYESVLDGLIVQDDAQQRLLQQVQVKAVLVEALQKLDSLSQKALQLYYEQELTQQEIAQELNVSQPTAYRRLIKARENIMASLVQWSREVLNICVTPNLIKDMSSMLEDWLRNYYKDLNHTANINLED